MLLASNAAYYSSLEYYNSVKEAARQRVAGTEAEYKYFKSRLNAMCAACTTVFLATDRTEITSRYLSVSEITPSQTVSSRYKTVG
jgi:hypothetical protein